MGYEVGLEGCWKGAEQGTVNFGSAPKTKNIHPFLIT